MRHDLYFLLTIRKLTIIVLFTFSATGWCNTEILAKNNQITQPNLRHISLTQGLSQNSVNSFYEDNDGLLWIATDAGVNRYDGSNMQSIANHFPKYQNKSINGIIQDKESNLWLSTDQGVVFIQKDLNTDRLSQIPSPSKELDSANMVIGVEQINSDQYWFFTWNGIYQYNLEGKDITQINSMTPFHSSTNNVLTYLLDGNRIWLGTNKGLYLFDSVDQSLMKVAIEKNLNILDISSIIKTSENQIIIGGKNGLYLLDVQNIHQMEVIQLSKNHITAISKLENSIYFSTSNSIKSINISNNFNTKKGKVIALFTLPNNISNDTGKQINKLFVDSRQLLWIGTENQGAFVWDTKTLAFKLWNNETNNKINFKRKKLNHNIQSIHIDKKNNYLIGTDIGLSYFNTKTNVIETIINSTELSSLRKKLVIHDLLEFDDSYWIASNEGLIKYDRSTNAVFFFKPQHIDKNHQFVIYSLTYSQPGMIWLASNRGVQKFELAEHKFSYEQNIMSEISAKSVQVIRQHNKQLLIGLPDKLILYNIDEKTSSTLFLNHKQKNGDSYQLTDIKVVENNIWLSYKGDGIYIIPTNQPVSPNQTNQIIRHFHTNEGFPDNQILSLEPRQGFMWAAGAQGLIKINITKMNYRIYNYTDGLTSQQFNSRASASNTKYVLFGGSKGLTMVNLTLLKDNDNNPPVVTEIEVVSDNNSTTNPFWKNDYLELKYNSNIVYVKYANLDYMSPKSYEFEYWLDNSNRKYVKTTRHQELTLTNLPYGQNVLNIRSRKIGQPNYSKATQLEIIVHESDWFTIPNSLGNYLLLLILILTLFYRRHLNSVKTQLLIEKNNTNKDRMELALLDGKRGIWECFIDKLNYKNSIIIIYHNKREPTKVDLESYFKMIYPKDLEKARYVWKLFLSGKNNSFNETYRNLFFQHRVWNRVYGKINSYYENNQPKYAVGTWVDISQEKETEKTLNIYNHAFQNTRDIIFILDNTLTITMINESYEKVTGFSRETIIEKNVIDVAFSRFSKKEINNIRDQVNENKRWRGESSLPRKNSTSIPIEMTISVVSTDNIDQVYIVIVNELSQVKPSNEKSTLTTSFYDQVTGLPNKTLAFDRLKQLLKQCKESEQELSIIFLSVDHFSKLESFLKADSIDILMVKICNRILPYIQKDDVFARYDLDTFIIILKQSNDENNVLHTVNQLLREISKSFVIDEKAVNISASAGISSYPDDSKNWSELVTKAETALAQTKQQGVNLFKYYHEDSNRKALEKIGIENKLTRAFSEGELYLVYQPLIDLASMKTVELDINLRWRTEDERVIYPSHFLHIAEEIGMLKEFSNWLIEKSFSTLSRWNQEGLSICININVPVNYLLDQNSLLHIKEKLDFYKINPKFIFIAVREDDIEDKILQLKKVSEKLNVLGIRVVLDDFGESNASLQNLKKINFHTVKLDRSLVRNVGISKFNDRVLESIISLINDINIVSIAKGIETKEQLDLLIRNKCKFGQGFLLSDPLNESQVRQYLLNNEL